MNLHRRTRSQSATPNPTLNRAKLALCRIQSNVSSSSSIDSSSHNPSANRRTSFGNLCRRLSATYQRISHLSSSFTDSIHPNSLSHRTSSTDLRKFDSIPSSSLHRQPAPSSHHHYNDLSSHRKKVLGAVPDQWPMYSNDPQDYLLGPQIGFGTSSVVRLAHFKPRPGELCAVKVIDIDRLTIKQIEYLRRETLLMSLAKHPNVLRVRGEWIQDSSLCISMRLMKAGSVADLINLRFQEGFSESVIATVLIQAIAGLNYLHSNGWIHRDIKAANLLLDHDGTVLLADFGVSLDRDPSLDSNHHHHVPLSLCSPTNNSDRCSIVKLNLLDPSPHSSPILSYPQLQHGRQVNHPFLQRQASFVGTALFMAPEVVTHQLYTDKTDIWSFGITALEMALGRAPRSMNPPAKVLMKTVQEPSPRLDRRRIGSPHEYSKKFERLIDRCLDKDPSRRPTSKELLFNESFFRQARAKSFLVQTILVNLPPLEHRQERQMIPNLLPSRPNGSSIRPDVSKRAYPLANTKFLPMQLGLRGGGLQVSLEKSPPSGSVHSDPTTTPSSETTWDFNIPTSSSESGDSYEAREVQETSKEA